MSSTSADGISVTILGAAGFLGSQLAAQLLSEGLLFSEVESAGLELADENLAGSPISSLVLFDLKEPTLPPNPLNINVSCLEGDISDTHDLQKAVSRDTNIVFHLAAVVSGQAESDYESGNRVNVKGTEALCEVLMGYAASTETDTTWTPVRVVFTSSVASFSVPLDATTHTTTTHPHTSPTQNFLSDDSAQRPLNTYGSQKARCELLLTDLSRRGVIDAVTVRLPTVSVRPGLPNAAASSFLSGIIREPLLGLASNCPVPKSQLESTRVWLASPLTAINWLRWASVVNTSSENAKAKWGSYRSVTPPGVSVSIKEILDAIEEVSPEALRLITFQPDERVLNIVKSWPPGFFVDRGRELGFTESEGGITRIVKEYLEIGMEQTKKVRGL